jgi:hypothetical protein
MSHILNQWVFERQSEPVPSLDSWNVCRWLDRSDVSDIF